MKIHTHKHVNLHIHVDTYTKIHIHKETVFFSEIQTLNAKVHKNMHTLEDMLLPNYNLLGNTDMKIFPILNINQLSQRVFYFILLIFVQIVIRN